MKILNLNFDDYANFSYAQTLALKAVGLDARCVNMRPHPFDYDAHGDILPQEQIGELMRQADIIQLFHSHPALIEMIHKYQPKAKLTVWHTGSIYRADPVGTKQAFDMLGVKKHFTDQCEFLIRDNTLTYVAAAMDIAVIQNGRHLPPPTKPIKFAHYPSKPEVKGSETINQIVREVERVRSDKMKYYYDDRKVRHADQLTRMAFCDVYIELFKPVLNGNPYGCYGVTAFEAAALGKVVVTQNIYPTAYQRAYGCECPFIIANTEVKLKDWLVRLAGLSPEQIQVIQDKTFQWVQRNHSLEATGMRVKNILLQL